MIQDICFLPGIDIPAYDGADSLGLPVPAICILAVTTYPPDLGKSPKIRYLRSGFRPTYAMVAETHHG